ncbi:helix-hairpin-helix domain-containing protein [Methanolobus sp. WCC4]|uniref:helix-hairpin-helix domain-containing protein n=1 Tax=Methanolobus sp. WCC4 TaxID=3125784 RepID=UPI0030FAD81E
MSDMTAAGTDNYKTITKELMQIPGVGKVIADDLWNMGIRSTEELRNRDPEELYHQLYDFQGKQVDRCMLYVFRCAVYFASNDEHDPELLKWWNWKD